MNEWIIAPLLAVDPTGLPTHRAAPKPAAEPPPAGEKTEERRHGDRREDHHGERDDDFARGEDRRGDVA